MTKRINPRECTPILGSEANSLVNEGYTAHCEICILYNLTVSVCQIDLTSRGNQTNEVFIPAGETFLPPYQIQDALGNYEKSELYHESIRARPLKSRQGRSPGLHREKTSFSI